MGTQGPEEFEVLIREKLPELLRRRPDFRYEIMGIMAETFATRDNLASVLEKMDARQAESDRRFEKILAEIRSLREDSNRRTR